LEQQTLTGRLVCRPTDDYPYLATLSTDDLEHRRPVILIRSASCSVIPPPTRRVVGVGMDVAFFPRVLIDLIRLELLSFHQFHWRRFVGVVLEPLAQGQGLLIGQPQLLSQLRGTHPLGDAS
jgi:hypothetical protein